MSGIVGQIGAKSGTLDSGGLPSAGTVTQSGTTQLDYEEGTWTPTVSTAYGFSTGGTHTGNYRKIGDLVMVDCSLDFSSSEDYAVADRFWVGNMPYLPTRNGAAASLIGSGAMVQGGSFSNNQNVHGITSVNTAGVAEFGVMIVQVNGNPPNLDAVATGCTATYIA